MPKTRDLPKNRWFLHIYSWFLTQDSLAIYSQRQIKSTLREPLGALFL